MTSDGAGAAITPGEVVREQLRSTRKERRLNPDQAAAAYADPTMTATVLMNIEAGRRRTPVTIDELVRFAYVLDVPVEALLLPRGDHQVLVADGVTVDASGFLRWMRGEQPLESTDTKLYEAASSGVRPASGRSAADELREEFLAHSRKVFDAMYDVSEELHTKARQQMRDALTEIRDATASGASATDLQALIDGYLDRLK